ncbi:MAG TPA: MBL fold metallo-hydrolase [Gammaproteobacteria bacterium]|nr:MBL fold metallo-hydrolase [Gammaproteobacteria bacterium]
MKSVRKLLLSVACLFAIAAQTAEAQTMRVTLLGTGRPTPLHDRFEAATLVEAGETTLLFDAGRGASIRIWQLGMPLSEVDGVFVTHFHHDHISGLADFWLTGWLPPAFGRRTWPLAIWGPEGLSDITNGLKAAYQRDIDIRVPDENLPREAADFAVTEFPEEGGVVYERDGVTVQAFAVDHGELIKPAVGYRIDYAGRSVLISGDTRYDENIARIGEGVDVLIHEVVTGQPELYEQYPELIRIRDHHTTPEEVGRIFSMAEPRLAVYTHLVNLSAPGIPVVSNEELIEETRRTYDGPLVVGHDLMGIEIGDAIAVFDRTAPGLEL